MGTQLVAVRSALVDGLKDLPAFAKWEVTYIPLKGSTKRHRCFTDQARADHGPAGMRPNKTFRNESGSFDLVLYTEGHGKEADPVTLSNSLQAAGEAAEDFIAIKSNWSDEKLGVGISEFGVTGEMRLSEQWTDNGLSVALIYPITYRARLT